MNIYNYGHWQELVINRKKSFIHGSQDLSEEIQKNIYLVHSMKEMSFSYRNLLNGKPNNFYGAASVYSSNFSSGALNSVKYALFGQEIYTHEYYLRAMEYLEEFGFNEDVLREAIIGVKIDQFCISFYSIDRRHRKIPLDLFFKYQSVVTNNNRAYLMVDGSSRLLKFSEIDPIILRIGEDEKKHLTDPCKWP